MKVNKLTELILKDPLTQWYKNNIKAKDEHGLLHSDPFYRFTRIIMFIEKTLNTDTIMKSKWIDIGCGPGNFASIAKTLYACEMYAVDQWDLDKNIKDLPFTYIEKDISRHLPFEDNYFNVVSALELIEHMIDTDSFLDEMYRLLDARGYLILSTPNINCLRNRILVPFGRYPVPMEYKNTIHHVRLYNKKLLEKHLNEHGFEVINSIGVSFLRERWNKYAFFRYLSEKLANIAPQFCNNIITIARKNK